MQNIKNHKRLIFSKYLKGGGLKNGDNSRYIQIFLLSISLIFININLKVGNLGTVLHEASRLLADQFDVEPSAVVAVSRF